VAIAWTGTEIPSALHMEQRWTAGLELLARK